MKYRGSCHCGNIQFEIEADDHLEVVLCNCSICSKTGFLHLILPLSKFHLTCGKEYLHTYTFNTGVAKHTFCKCCGVKPFYTPRSNPDGIDINVRCLDPVPENFTITDFDGQNWEQHAHNLEHLSRDI